jgi:thiamine biosynthesis protein ThiS
VSDIRITVNGEARRLPRPASLKGLIETLGLDPRMIVVERNREIVRRPDLDGTPVEDGDVLELVHFVGGG